LRPFETFRDDPVRWFFHCGHWEGRIGHMLGTWMEVTQILDRGALDFREAKGEVANMKTHICCTSQAQGQTLPVNSLT
jgi:hypothetical protein